MWGFSDFCSDGIETVTLPTWGSQAGKYQGIEMPPATYAINLPALPTLSEPNHLWPLNFFALQQTENAIISKTSILTPSDITRNGVEARGSSGQENPD